MARDSATCPDDFQQLPIVHDGLPLIGASPAAYAVRAAVEMLDPDQRETLRRLQQAAPGTVAVLGDFFDDVANLLTTLGIGYRRVASEDLAVTGAEVVFAGCPHVHTRLDIEDVDRFLGRGGVLVSSCRAARLPGVAGYLPFDKPRGPRRARVSSAVAPDGEMLYPAVALDPGHFPLSHKVDDFRDVAVLARDVLDDRPVVVVANQGRGAIVHSVAHWWQDKAEGMTEVESRRLVRVPGMASLANSYTDLTWGGFRAARVMLAALLDGVGLAMGQARWAVQRNGTDEMELNPQ